jgi:hypothetical protein
MAKMVKPMNARKDSSRIKGVARADRRQKREEAEIRQTARSKRSVEEQLTILDARPGDSKKEKARLVQNHNSEILNALTNN